VCSNYFLPHWSTSNVLKSSLGATILRRRIHGALQSDKSSAPAAEFVNQNTIYSYPTVEALVEFITSTVRDPSSAAASSAPQGVDAVEAMIAKHTIGLDVLLAPGRVPDKNKLHVLITGTTGNLGSQVLESMLRDKRVERVYVLNRPSSGESMKKHLERFEDKGFDGRLLASSKLVLLEGDVAKDGLALPKEVYAEVSPS
jgi:hypothetical protein